MASAEDSSTQTTETAPAGEAPPASPPPADEKPADKPKAEKRAKGGAAVLNVFDGPVKDPEAARRPAPEGTAGAPAEKKGKGRKGKGPSVPEPTAEEVEEKRARMELQARGILTSAINMQKMIVTKQYTGYIGEEKLAALLARLDFTPEELDAMAPPLAEGMVEGEIELPWWAQLGLAVAGSGILQRQAAVQAALKAAVAEHEQQIGQLKIWNAETARYEQAQS